MKYITKLTLAFLLTLFIGPMIFISSYYGHTVLPTEPNTVKDFSPAIDGNEWLTPWEYRRTISITGSAGAGTLYQVQITVSFNAHMQTDFDDIRFTDNDGSTELDYWIETYVASSYGVFWVNVTDDLGSNQDIYIYYGNDAVSTTSNGTATFQEFYDKDSTAGWSTSGGLTVTTSGDFLRFYNPVAANVGYAQRTDITTSADFQYMAQYKTVSLGANDVATTILIDASTSHRFSQSMTPYANIQTEWYYYNGTTQAGGAWTEGTEFIFTVQVDEGDDATGVDFRRYNTAWALQDSILAENFALGTPTDCDGINIGDQSGAGTIDAYFRWIAFRKCIDTEPESGAFGDEELYSEWSHIEWHEFDAIEFFFPVKWTSEQQFGYDAFFILLGLIMIPASTMYLVRGGRKDMSMDKFFYGVIIFAIGIGFLIGGIMP